MVGLAITEVYPALSTGLAQGAYEHAHAYSKEAGNAAEVSGAASRSARERAGSSVSRLIPIRHCTVLIAASISAPFLTAACATGS